MRKKNEQQKKQPKRSETLHGAVRFAKTEPNSTRTRVDLPLEINSVVALEKINRHDLMSAIRTESRIQSEDYYQMIRRVGRRGGPLEWNRVHQKVFTGDRKKKRVGWVGVRERERNDRAPVMSR